MEKPLLDTPKTEVKQPKKKKKVSIHVFLFSFFNLSQYFEYILMIDRFFIKQNGSMITNISDTIDT